MLFQILRAAPPQKGPPPIQPASPASAPPLPLTHSPALRKVTPSCPPVPLSQPVPASPSPGSAQPRPTSFPTITAPSARFSVAAHLFLRPSFIVDRDSVLFRRLSLFVTCWQRLDSRPIVFFYSTGADADDCLSLRPASTTLLVRQATLPRLQTFPTWASTGAL